MLFRSILGTIIAFVIIKAAIEMLSETLSSMIGTRVDNEITDKLKDRISEFDEVLGVYDLTLHNYGPTQLMGSVHVEVKDDLTAKEIHKLTRKILYAVYEEFGIILTVGIYASNEDSEETKKIKESLNKITSKYPEILQVHGFYLDDDINLVTFDLIIDFEADRHDVKEKVLEEIRALYPDYHFDAILDADYSD